MTQCAFRRSGNRFPFLLTGMTAASLFSEFFSPDFPRLLCPNEKTCLPLPYWFNDPFVICGINKMFFPFLSTGQVSVTYLRREDFAFFRVPSSPLRGPSLRGERVLVRSGPRETSKARVYGTMVHSRFVLLLPSSTRILQCKLKCGAFRFIGFSGTVSIPPFEQGVDYFLVPRTFRWR